MFYSLLLLISCISTHAFEWREAPKVTDTEWVNKLPKDTTAFLAAYPLVFYFPETRFGFGVAGIHTFSLPDIASNKSSNIQVGAAYTQNKQLLLYSAFNIFRKGNTQVINGEIGYYDYFYPFYGVGNQTIVQDEEPYYVRFPRIKTKMLFSVKPNVYIGPIIHFDAYRITRVAAGGILDSGILPGSSGGRVGGVGIAYQVDQRDYQFYPSSGHFIDISVLQYGRTFGSEFSYRRLNVDVSKYFPILPRLIVATNLNFAKAGAGAPFQEMALFGGPKYARGYTLGRFREANSLILQTELRFPVWWRFKGCIFGSAGNVGSDISDLGQNIKWNYGAGLRILLNKTERIHCRIDHGRSTEGGATYITITEAF